MKRMTRISACPRGCAAALCVVLAAGGCADVSVRRATGDKAAKGFRYYLPRPYVVVHRPFAVAGDDFYVAGRVVGNDVVEIDVAGLPDAVRQRFPGATGADGKVDPTKARIPASQLRAPVSPEGATGPAGSRAQSGADAPKGAAATPIPSNDWLTVSDVTNNPLLIGKDAFDAKFKIAKAAGFDAITADSIEVGLVPVGADGAADTKAFTAMAIKSRTDWAKGTTDGEYAAAGLRANLKNGSDYAWAVRFRGKRTGDTAEGTFVLHRTAAEFIAVGVKPAPGPKEDAGGSTGGGGITEKSMTEAGLVVGGDPNTDPHVKLNDHFDVLYLPDFDEQYAVEVKPGLGMAGAGVGMENGWMVERAALQIDNRELGKFVFSNIQKAIDLGLDALKTAIAPGSVQAEAAAQAAGQAAAAKAIAQAGEDGRPVLLRVRYVIEAQPGLYPVLKPAEARALRDGTIPSPPRYVYVPYPPVTVVGYDARLTLLVELADARPQANGDGGGRDAARPRQVSEGAALQAIREAFQAYVADPKRTFRQGAAIDVGSLLGNPPLVFVAEDRGTRSLTVYTAAADVGTERAALNSDFLEFLTRRSAAGQGLTVNGQSIGAVTFEPRGAAPSTTGAAPTRSAPPSAPGTQG